MGALSASFQIAALLLSLPFKYDSQVFGGGGDNSSPWYSTVPFGGLFHVTLSFI